MGSSAPAATTDPVCGMTVDASGPRQHAHRGRVYRFCSDRCLGRFRADPEQFLGAARVEPADLRAAPGASWTCPMDPEIVREVPGPCPICGMALEPMEPVADGDNPELADMWRRFGVSLALTVPLFLIAMGEMVPGNPWSGRLPVQTLAWVQLALATPVVGYGGWPFLQRGLASLRTGNLNMFTLIAIGTGTAFVYSTIATLRPGVFPAAFRGEAGEVAVYF